MNKTALKRFASKARKELLERIQLQAMKLGITADSIAKATVESSDSVFIGERQLTDIERRQRNKLIARIEEIGFDRVMDEAAYTWFNRFIALRYMEVNDYLPTKVRVLSSADPDSTEPDMMKEALSLDLELDKELVYELKMENKTDDLFKYLIKMHCNDLNRYMPFMFETIEDYTEILFPEGLLGTESFVRQMTETEVIPEDNWEKVEIIGWLYQYYISDENERVIKAKKRYKAEEIPFATQLFTPEWIVRYMVQNALGRYWVESHPEHKDLVQDWEFYLESRESDVEEKLATYINRELNVEEIKCFDPAMGSGHILVYMFDILFEIYSKCGYMEREIPRLIIEKNLYGLDIDDRAHQLASFSIIMKALQHNKRFLRSIEREGLSMNLASIQETNSLTEEDIAFLAGEDSGQKFEKMKSFVEQFRDAKAIGSLVKIEVTANEFILRRIEEIQQQPNNLFALEQKDRLLDLYDGLIEQTKLMASRYDVFITNPPYAGSKYITPEVSSYLTKYYPDVKSDLFSSFIEYSFSATKDNGQVGFMTPFVWMFISSYEKLRNKIINERTISSLIQLEYSGFDGATVPICTFTLRNYASGLAGEYVRLSDFRGVANQPEKTKEAVQNSYVPYRYTFNQESFSKIPGSPIAYWVGKDLINTFTHNKSIGEVVEAKVGLQTGDNNKFIRFWHECSIKNIEFDRKDIKEEPAATRYWVPFNKGGYFRKWYGNQEYVINWKNNGEYVRANPGSVIRNPNYYFKKSISWSDVTSSDSAFRFYESGFIFGSGGHAAFPTESVNAYQLLALLNNKFINYIIKVLSPTLHFDVGYFGKLPALLSRNNEIVELVKENIFLAKSDWDDLETSWNFKSHPLLKYNVLYLKKAFVKRISDTDKRFEVMKRNEEMINQAFINQFNLHGNLTPEVLDEDITINKSELVRDVKSFISYSIGCLFGRYSLDEEGLIYAGDEFDLSRYTKFPVDVDNILPILVGDYFEDDIVTHFVDFVRITFTKETLEENLGFVADAIGRRKNETARETLRRYFLNDFYKDHVQVYKKRPIYWLFTSGKEKAFNCLIYMHRYDKTTLSRIRTDYLHEVQTRMDAEKQDLLGVIEGDSTAREISSAKKELKSLDKKIDELKAYDELLHHYADMQIEIDLDDGVRVNYEKFKGLAAKI